MSERNGACGQVKRQLALVVMAVANLLCVDLVTKKLAAGFLKGSAAVSVIPGFFDLAYVENRGCAWGMFQGHVWPLALFAFAALGFLVWKRREIFRPRWVEPILYAGILGNLADRVFRGYVIDFVDLHWFDAYHFPCFNFADVYITVSAATLLVASFFIKEAK